MKAVLFDIDGTLVDSVYLHVDSWSRAFTECGVTVPTWEIHRRIGKDGGLLLSELLELAGHDADDPRGAEAKKLHTKHYESRSGELAVLPGARELLRDCASRDLRVVLATSAPASELEILRDLLDVEDAIYAVTSGEDAETAKPDSSIVQVALERAGVAAQNAVMVGDATWDAVAATKIDVATVGVLTGGISADELTNAGARWVYDGAEALRLDPPW